MNVATVKMLLMTGLLGLGVGANAAEPLITDATTCERVQHIARLRRILRGTQLDAG